MTNNAVSFHKVAIFAAKKNAAKIATFRFFPIIFVFLFLSHPLTEKIYAENFLNERSWIELDRSDLFKTAYPKEKEFLDHFFHVHHINAETIKDVLKFEHTLRLAGFDIKRSAGSGDTCIAFFPDKMPFVLKAIKPTTQLTRNIARAWVAKKINHLGFETIGAPRKYLYHIPGAGPELIDDNYLVISEKVSIDYDKDINDLTPQMLTEFINTIQLIQYCDTKFYVSKESPKDHEDSNIYFDTTGRLIFLDTEPRGDMIVQEFEYEPHYAEAFNTKIEIIGISNGKAGREILKDALTLRSLGLSSLFAAIIKESSTQEAFRAFAHILTNFINQQCIIIERKADLLKNQPTVSMYLHLDKKILKEAGVAT